MRHALSVEICSPLVHISAQKPIVDRILLNSSTNYCAGVSSAALWQPHTPTSMTMAIDTSGCGFNSTPIYLTSIAGLRLHDGLIGSGAVYSRTATAFRIYVYSALGWPLSFLLNSSRTYDWDVNWVGLFWSTQWTKNKREYFLSPVVL